MLKKKITYEDFNGNEVTEELCFNLSKTELANKQLTTEGGLDTMLKKIVEEKDNAKMAEVFKEIILASYGEKTEDGKGFRKIKNGVKLSEEFEFTAAFDALYFELITDADKASAFINGILPADLRSQINSVSNS